MGTASITVFRTALKHSEKLTAPFMKNRPRRDAYQRGLLVTGLEVDNNPRPDNCRYRLPAASRAANRPSDCGMALRRAAIGSPSYT